MSLQIKDLTIWLRDRNQTRCLLNSIQLDVALGSVVMLVGTSGSGKSTILKLLAGLNTPLDANIEISGSCCLLGHELVAMQYPRELRGHVGLVFQDFALFDDFTPKENIALVGKLCLHTDSSNMNQEIKILANQLNIENILEKEHVHELSGGQKQRVALARLLIARPKIMLFDEPISGLDPATAQDAAGLILKQARPDNILIIVSHDYRPFLAHLEKIHGFYILDGSGSLHSVPYAGQSLDQILSNIEHRLCSARPGISQTLPRLEHHNMAQADFFCQIFSRVQQCFGLRHTLHPPFLQPGFFHRKLLWKIFRFSILDAIPFMLVSGLMLGMLATYFSLSENLGELQRYLDPILFSQALAALGKIAFVVLCPLFTAIFMATRSGAAVAGYLGNVVITKQMDAYRVYGLPSERLFLSKIVWSFGLGFLLLSALCFAGFVLASMMTVMVMRETASYYDWNIAFYSLLGPFPYQGWGYFVLKTVLAGIGAGMASYWIGAGPKKNSQDVTAGITRCVIVNILLVLAIFFALLLCEKERLL